MKNFLFIALVLGILLGCHKDDEIPEINTYSLSRPAHFPEIVYPIESNPISQKGFELGKKLFNEPMLSIDNSVACSNCHVKAVAFTDPQHNPSIGVFERSGTRNAPMVANMAFQKEFLLDGGVSHLDFVPIFAIENQNEMAESIAGVVQKLNNSSAYPTLFKNVFPEIDTITSPYMLKALSQYMLLLVSDKAKYDQVIRGEEEFTVEESNGQSIFNQKCASCHSGNLFTNQDFINNGLDTMFIDIGRALISETDHDLGKFKVPSLRNIERTSPYMHDGRFNNLEDVIHHYRFGVKGSSTLAEELQSNGQLGIQLTDEEAEYLIEFLKSLTDYEFISNPIF